MSTETRPALAPSGRPIAVVDESGSDYDRETVEIIERRADGVLCLIQRNGLAHEILVAAVKTVTVKIEEMGIDA
jgi:hypothetical protein